MAFLISGPLARNPALNVLRAIYGDEPRGLRSELLRTHYVPVPHEFSEALWGTRRLMCRPSQQTALGKPFTGAWIEGWTELAREEDQNSIASFELFIKRKKALESLRSLSEKGADVNFILSLFIQY